MDKPFLYFIVKLVALIASISILGSAKVDITFMVISALSFICVFVLELLVGRWNKQKLILRITMIACITACFLLGLDLYFPLFIVILVHMIELLVDSSMFYYILVVVLVLAFFIFVPSITASILTANLLVMILFCRIILSKLEFYKEMNEEQKETILEQTKKIAEVKSLTKTMKYSISIEERNRIATRIHDQVGHGISGSIIMLEAAMLIMKDDPEKATTSIQKAITNLRDGVDEIRTSLRDERSERYLIGLNDIKTTLEEFKVSYNKATILNTSGDLDLINLEIWACIHDNLKECLTNVLKHSNANEFVLNIEIFKKIIKVEYKDNGTSSEGFEKGMGLEAIEERTIGAKGRCFFNQNGKGFWVTNIFTY